jgi:putative hydrolase of the HAD superfamily
MSFILGNEIQTLLFDLDDTLIVEWKSAEECFIETMKLSGLQIDANEFVKTVRDQAREHWYKLPTIDFSKKIGISSWEALWADFTGEKQEFSKLRELAPGYRFETWYSTLKKFHIDDPDLAEKLSIEFKKIRSSRHVLFPETIATLSKLKTSYTLGLITNGAPDLQWKKINGGGLVNYFSAITISGEHGYAKPDKRIFDVAMQTLKAKKAETIMIGDNLSTDIKGAQQYGLKTIWINRSSIKPAEIRPDYEITRLSDIFDILPLPATNDCVEQSG